MGGTRHHGIARACTLGAAGLLWSACGGGGDPQGLGPSTSLSDAALDADDGSPTIEAGTDADAGAREDAAPDAAFDAAVTPEPIEGSTVQPAAGCTEPNFGTEGRLATAVGSGSDIAYALAADAEGRLIAAGTSWNGSNYDFALVRYSKEGVADDAFGMHGIVTAAASPGQDNYVLGVAVQADGAIVAAGSSWKDSVGRIALARYLADGTPDKSFGNEGVTSTERASGSLAANALLLGDSGKIVVAGSSSHDAASGDFMAIRYDESGHVDQAFGDQGFSLGDFGAFDEALAAARQPDGKIVLVGYTQRAAGSLFAAARLMVDGSPDLGFGFTGKITIDFDGARNVANAVALQPDGKILLAGVHDDGVHRKIAVARLTSGGQPDATFGQGGRTLTSAGADSVANAIALYSDDAFAVAGSSDHAFAVVRYDASGALHGTSGAAAAVTVASNGAEAEAHAALLEASGSLVLAGSMNAGTNDDFGLTALCP